MADLPKKIGIALVLLVSVWIGVYWWWEPSGARISFAESRANAEPVRDAPLPAVNDPTAGPDLAPPSVTPRAPDAAPPVEADAETKPESGEQGPKTAHPDPRVAVIPPEFQDYTVETGDTLSKISHKVFGTGSHAAAIARANPLTDPERLKPGRVIRVPKDPANVQGKPVPRPPALAEEPKTYVVKSGDTLSRISQQFYGSSTHGGVIFEANRDKLKSPDELKVGLELKIPPKPSAGSPAGAG